MLAYYTITNGKDGLVLRDAEDGDLIGNVASETTISASTDSHSVVEECRSLLIGPVESVDHDKDTIHVTCKVPFAIMSDDEREENTREVRVNHRSTAFPQSRWVTPVGWEPTNKFSGSEFVDGSWWDDNEETHGIVLLGADDLDEGDTYRVALTDLRVASCGNCQIVENVTV